jgi:plastocyanin
MNRPVRCAAPITIVVALLCLSAAPKEDAKPHKIKIQNLKYDPAKLTIKVGQTVIWTNNDDHDHTVVAKNDAFDSENLTSGDSFKYTFAKVGKYEYFCRYHPRMKGTVTVEE